MEASRLEKVYEYLHKPRVALRGVNQPAMELIENWFRENHTSEVDSISSSQNQLKEALLRNGGGWHGLGWLGEGGWIVQRSNIASDGKCSACGEQLVCVDIDRAEIEKFEQSIASFAMEREVQSNFKEFQVQASVQVISDAQELVGELLMQAGVLVQAGIQVRSLIHRHRLKSAANLCWRKSFKFIKILA